MSKANSKSTERLLIAGTVAWMLLGIVTTAAGQRQAGSPQVPANIGADPELLVRRQAGPNPSAVMAAPEGFDKLKIEPGFLLQMDVYNVPEMSTSLRIDSNGDATVPLIGPVHVAGATVAEAQAAIGKALESQEILKAPQVTLNIMQYSAKNISVVGEVMSPGRLQLLAPTPLGDVIAQAGGETNAAGKEIDIQHHSENGETTTRTVEYLQGTDPAKLHDVIVNPGDTVLVHRAGIIYVLGAVAHPGGYLMVNSGSLSLVQAISLAGGTTLPASTKWAIIVRPQGNGYVQLKVPLKKMETGSATPIQLQLNDALYVPTSEWKAVMTSSSNIVSTIGAALIYRGP